MHRRGLHSSQRIAALRLLFGTSQLLGVLLLVDIVVTAVLPNLLLVALGVMVGRLPPAVGSGWSSPQTASVLRALAFVALALVGAMVAAPFHQTLGSIIRVRLTQDLQARVMRTVGQRVGIAHLEDSTVLDRIAMSQGTLMSFFPGDAPATLAVVVGYRITWISGAVIVGIFRWWLGLAILLLWQLARRPILRVINEHVGAFGGNANIMRRAVYFFDVATRPPAAKELRIFGLGAWAVERMRSHWVDAMREVWRIRSGMVATISRVGVAVLVVYVAAAWFVVDAALDGSVSLKMIAILLPVLSMTSWGGGVSLEDISLQWQLTALPPLDDLEHAVDRAARDLTGEVQEVRGGDIRFEGVSFRYESGTTDVISDLDLTLLAGSSTAIVGTNGAGKTTLIKLLARLHDPTGGRILVGDEDLSTIDPAAWRRQIAVVFQDFVRYPLSAADNIAFGAVDNRDDRAGIERAAELAGIADAIRALPDGWDTVLSRQYTGGADLSGGQWQRVALARAVFAAQHGASVLVLDEPTAWMDARGEADFYSTFLELTAGVTSLVISHRFSTVRLAQTIHVLRNGRMAESGSHEELLAQNGRYARLFRMQASRFAAPTDGAGEESVGA